MKHEADAALGFAQHPIARDTEDVIKYDQIRCDMVDKKKLTLNNTATYDMNDESSLMIAV